MRWFHWLIVASLAIFAADWAWAHFEVWRKKRDEFIRNERIHRYNVAAFRGTRKINKDQFFS